MANCNILDIARVFLTLGELTNKQLQKLCYYAQAWYIAFYNEPLIACNFEAWIHGPVCPELYHEYKSNKWSQIPKESCIPRNVDENIVSFIKTIYSMYGKYDGDELEAFTHREMPWRKAREGLDPWEPSHNIICEDDMKEYYRKVLLNQAQVNIKK